jgi:GDPmannose 4,6-dehydratase
MAKRALITGITGQDGSYLAEFLLGKGYDVHGIARHCTSGAAWRLAGIEDRIQLHQGDLDDPETLNQALSLLKPDECYHLAGETRQGFDEETERNTLASNVLGTHHLLAAVRIHAPECRVLLAGSAEMFGGGEHSPQNESTPFHARSIYGASKIAVTHLGQVYRHIHGVKACTAILYNHESPRRGEGFVTRKITLGAARIKLGLDAELRLGNLDVRKDWGHARSFVKGMWRMLQQDEPEEFILATGKLHTVREFARIAFDCVGLDADRHIVIDPAFFRPLEAHQIELCGDASKAERMLGWTPEGTFEDLVREMVQSDLQRLSA